MAGGRRNRIYEAVRNAFERGEVTLQADADLERTLRGFDLSPRPAEDVLAAAGLAPWPDTDPAIRAGDLVAVDGRGNIVPAGPGQQAVGVFNPDYINTQPTANPSGVDLWTTMGQIRATLGVQTVAGTPVAGARSWPAPPPTPLRARVRHPGTPEIDGRICAIEGLDAFTDPRLGESRARVRCLGKGREHLTAEVPLTALETVADEAQAAFISGDRVKVTLRRDERGGEAGTIIADWETDPDTTGVWVHLDADPQGINLAYHPDWLDRLYEESAAPPVEMGVDLAAPPARRTLLVRYADGEERRSSGSPDELAAAIQALATVPGVSWEWAE